MRIQLVRHWQTGWKWFSTWAFALIVFVATTPLPDELLSVLPSGVKDKVLAGLAVCGLLLRFICQSPHPNPHQFARAGSNEQGSQHG